MTRSTVFALVAMVLLLPSPAVSDGALQQQSIATNAAVRDLDILPTLKGHMAELGTQMNVLWRDVENAQRTPRVRRAIAAMSRLLDSVARHHVPQSVRSIPDVQQRDEARVAFLSCAKQAKAHLVVIDDKLANGDYAAAKQVLLELDQHRRDCHGRFAN